MSASLTSASSTIIDLTTSELPAAGVSHLQHLHNQEDNEDLMSPRRLKLLAKASDLHL